MRGPATLLYGANAIGGLVNMITEDIPTGRCTGAQRQLHLRSSGSAAKEAGAAADVHVGNGTFALHAGGGGRRSGDVGHAGWRGRELAVAQRLRQRRRCRGPGAKGYFGGSYGYDDTKYGIPVVEDGQSAADAAAARVLAARRRRRA